MLSKPSSSQFSEPMFKRRARFRSGRSKIGRFWVVAIFLWLRLIDGLVLFGFQNGTFLVQKQWLLPSIMLGAAVWTTLLLVGIWCRLALARGLLIVTLLACLTFSLAAWPALRDLRSPRNEFLIIAGCIMGYLPSVLVLISSRHIAKLATSRTERLSLETRAG